MVVQDAAHHGGNVGKNLHQLLEQSLGLRSRPTGGVVDGASPGREMTVVHGSWRRVPGKKTRTELPTLIVHVTTEIYTWGSFSIEKF